MATLDLAPHLPATKINTILAKTVSAMTLQDLKDIEDGLKRFPKAWNDLTQQVGNVFP
jgi:hypothetical protein